MFNNIYLPIETNSVNVIYQDNVGMIWIGTKYGLFSDINTAINIKKVLMIDYLSGPFLYTPKCNKYQYFLYLYCNKTTIYQNCHILNT